MAIGQPNWFQKDRSEYIMMGGSHAILTHVSSVCLISLAVWNSDCSGELPSKGEVGLGLVCVISWHGNISKTNITSKFYV